MIQRANVLFILFLVLFTLFPYSLSADEQLFSEKTDIELLRFGFATGENPAIIFEKFTPLLTLLSRAIDIPIEFYQTYSYRETQEVFSNGTVDLGILNALSYVGMIKNQEIIPIAARVINGVKNYRTYIIVKKNSPLYSYDDLRGSVFAMGDPYSTSATFMPKIMMRANDIDPDTDLQQVRSFTKQDSIFYAILNGTVDAGAVASFIFDEYDGKVTSRLRILDRSEPFPLGPFVIQRRLGNTLIEKVQEFLLSLHTFEEGRAALEIAELDYFSSVNPGDYKWIVDNAAESGM
jgi:phosphonate transport system substrate-binding protein